MSHRLKHPLIIPLRVGKYIRFRTKRICLVIQTRKMSARRHRQQPIGVPLRVSKLVRHLTRMLLLVSQLCPLFWVRLFIAITEIL
jgi:hypothetical protein